MIKAVLFDLDGVLVDSEVLDIKIIKEFIKLNNLPIPIERFYLMIGSHKSLDPWKTNLSDLVLPEPLDEIKTKLRLFKKKAYRSIDISQFIFQSTKPSLSYLKDRNVKLACCSSSSKEYIIELLKACNIIKFFDVIVSSDDFCRSKPDGEIYTYCRNKFRLEKEECLVVEDSTLGIMAGKNAGIKVAAINDYNFGMDQSLADYHVDNLEQLVKLIEKGEIE